MVIGLWVIMTKRVSRRSRHLVHQVAVALDVMIIEQRVRFVEHTQIGARLVERPAKINAIAVSACSPPDSSVMVCGFLPNGRARPRPLPKGSSGFDQLQLGPCRRRTGG